MWIVLVRRKKEQISLINCKLYESEAKQPYKHLHMFNFQIMEISQRIFQHDFAASRLLKVSMPKEQ